MQNANDNYSHFNGTDFHYKHSFSNIVYTDGIKSLATDCKAYWLIDLVVSHQLRASVRAEGFQVWKLERVKVHAFKIVATDGNDIVLATQKIPFSDFPYDSCTVWLVEGILMLPSEY